MATKNTLSAEEQNELLNEFKKFNDTLGLIVEGEEKILKLSDIANVVLPLPESVYPGVMVIHLSVQKRLKQVIGTHAENINNYNESLLIINKFINNYPEIAEALPKDFAETFLPL